MVDTLSRIAITGASGYIGMQLISELESSDHVETILAIDLRKSERMHYSKKIVFVRRDVRKPMYQLFKLYRIQAVVDLTFILNPTRNKERHQSINVGGITNLLDSISRSDVGYLLFLSNESMYGPNPEKLHTVSKIVSDDLNILSCINPTKRMPVQILRNLFNIVKITRR